MIRPLCRSGDSATPEDYQRAVRSAVEEIKAGEAFQIVVSQRFEVDTTADALDIYRVLRLTNPSPYMYLLRLDDFDIVGSSPEALVSVKGTTAVTHPIAGSKPRGGTPAEDAALEAELLADPKERAEHVMLVDLGRNDLGRVCQPGTVEVVEFMEVRRYSHIMHLESTVTGTIAEDRTALDVVLAAFPAGTLSGAPKVRAMEIIDELEITRRGLYGGVVGYLDFAGDADAAIAIRTAVLRDGVAFVQAGGGIVADSDPPTEDQETQNKAAAVVKAISVAESFAAVGPSAALLTAESDRRMKSRALAFGCLLLGGDLGAHLQRAAVVAGYRRRCRGEVHRNPGHRRIESSAGDSRVGRDIAHARTAGPGTPRGRRATAPGGSWACPRRSASTAAERRCCTQPGP